MRYADICVPRADAGAHDLHLVDSVGFDDWRATLSPRARTAVLTHQFSAIPGQIVILPGEFDTDWFAALGVTNTSSLGPWELACAPERLPPGTYRVEGSMGLEVLGWLLAHYRFEGFQSTRVPPEDRRLVVDDTAAIEPVRQVAEAISFVRDLVNRPGGDLTPAALAAEAQVVCSKFGATLNVIEGRILEGEYPAIHAVGRAASVGPCLIDIRWGRSAHPSLTLIGKGVCFDSGGLDLKTAPAMALMKKDMAGAAHALALGQLVMAAGLPVNLRVLVPAVENAISGNALRPGDIVATRKGVSVEVGNTDAEGRLILADALTAAQEERPSLIIDFATLTGAARVALGPDIPAFFSNDETIADGLMKAAADTDDPMWRLPLWGPYRAMLKSDIADISNYAEGGMAGAITAALFLEHFIDPGQAWAHLDLFGWNLTARPGRPRGGEAAPLRSVWEYLQRRYQPNVDRPK